MKKIGLVLALLAVITLAGCAGMGTAAQHTPGFLFSEAKVPAWDLTVQTSTDASTRSGSAVCKSILGLVAMGDCSIEAAKKAGGITKVNNAEFELKNILGVYAEYTTRVYGQ